MRQLFRRITTISATCALAVSAAAAVAVAAEPTTGNILTGKLPTTNSTHLIGDGDTGFDPTDSNITKIIAGEENGSAENNGYASWDDVYLQYDFGEPREIHSINLYRNGYENALNTFKRIKVEVSSNEDFSAANVLFGTADVEETAATKLAAQTINLTTPVTARYVRIWQKGQCIQNTNSSWKGYGNGVGLREIEVIAKLKDGETLPDAQETRNIALGKLPYVYGLDPTNIAAISDGKQDDNYAVKKINGERRLQNKNKTIAYFGGYKDFVLDDLKVEHVASAEHTKADAEAKLKEVKDTYDGKSGDYSAEVWTTYVNTVAEIEALIAKDKPDYTTAYNKAVALAEYMKNAPGDDSNDADDVATDAYIVEAGSQQALAGGNEGPASLAQDGNAGTHWHTSWSANAVSAGTAWYQFNLNEPTTIDGLRYMARSGGANANGKIKKYKITLTLSDGTTKDVVTNGTFTTTSRVWQKVKFDAVTTVTTVRITALETAGQSAGEVNTYASAAELRVTTVRAVPRTEVKVNKCDLQNLYDDASALTEATYTADTWKVLVAKRDAAKKVLDDENATAHDVALAYQNLKDAIAALEERVDTSKLAGLVADAEKLKESAYTKDSWAAFKKALDAAKAVLNNANATKADVDAAYNALNAAMKALKPASSKPTPNPETTDKSKLQATIDQAKALDLSGYTKKSAQAVRDALAKAQRVLADDNATQAGLDAAQKALAAAIAALEKADANGNAISKTGANIAVIGMAGMMLVAAAGAVFIARKRAE